MTNLTPLYIDGKRDSRRRYVTPTGEIISRREQIRRTEGVTPEEKAVRRYKEGKSKAGVTVLQALRREKGRKVETKKVTELWGDEDRTIPEKGREKGRKVETKKVTELWGDEDRTIPEKEMPTGGERGYYQLQGTYQFYNPTIRDYDTATGYSTADDERHPYGTPNYLILRRQAIMNAAAQLDGYEWKYIGVVEENWLLW